MNIFAVSDTHGRHWQLTIPECDLFIHAGDFTGVGHVAQYKNFAIWIESLKVKHKVVVPGNHELNWEVGRAVLEAEAPSVTLLEDSGTTIDGLSIYGSPRTPTFGNWAFMERGTAIIKYWDNIPKNLDILITHGPPRGILDKTHLADGTPYESVGCMHLYTAVMSRAPKVHIFGHIHENYGNKDLGATRFYNVAVVDDRNQLLEDITPITIPGY